MSRCVVCEAVDVDGATCLDCQLAQVNDHHAKFGADLRGLIARERDPEARRWQIDLLRQDDADHAATVANLETKALHYV
jgi:hypothetical protein